MPKQKNSVSVYDANKFCLQRQTSREHTRQTLVLAIGRHDTKNAEKGARNAERPLLRLPNPERIEAPGGQPAVTNIRQPERVRQRDRLAPIFDRLQTVLNRTADPIALREDPTALAPDRVLVFEIAGTIQNFVKALNNIPGLEFMANSILSLSRAKTSRSNTQAAQTRVGTFWIRQFQRGSTSQCLISARFVNC